MKNRFRGIFLISIILSGILVSGAFVTPQQKEPVVLIETSYGNIRIKLYNETPLHRDNFLKLASEGKYNGSTFHRVINQFMIQGGGLNHGQQDLGQPIPAEITFPQHYHKRGALAAARMGDDVNPERKSSGSQFYIVQGRTFDANSLNMLAQRAGVVYTPEQIKTYTTLGGTPHLDNAYTVFGEVIEGMDVVDKIAAVKTQYDRPVEDIVMKMKVLSK